MIIGIILLLVVPTNGDIMGSTVLYGERLKFALKHASTAQEVSKTKNCTYDKYVQGKFDFDGKPMTKFQLVGWMRHLKLHSGKQFSELSPVRETPPPITSTPSQNDSTEELKKDGSIRLNISNGMSIDVEKDFDREVLKDLILFTAGLYDTTK